MAIFFSLSGTGMYIRTVKLDSFSHSLALVHWIPFCLVWVENKSLVHVALPKQTINQFKPIQESIQQALRAYSPNVYTEWKIHMRLATFEVSS